MVIQQLHQSGGVKENRRVVAGEIFFDQVVIFLLPQPVADGHRESLFGTVGPLVGQGAVGGMTHDHLGVRALNAVAGGNGLGKGHHFFIQEGHPQLQTVRHAHFVGLQKDVSRKPQVHVQILLFSHFVLVFDAGVDFAGQCVGRGTVSVGGLQNGLGFLFREDQGLTQEGILGPLGTFQQEIFAFEIGHFLGHVRSQTAQRAGDALELLHGGGIGVPFIPGKNLIRTFAGQDHRHMLPGQLGQKIQRHAGRVGLGFVHVILDVGERVKAFLGGQQFAVIGHAQLFGQFSRVIGLVELVIVKAHAERVVRHQAGGDITGVHAAGQERTHLDVRDAVRLHGFVHGFIQLLGAGFKVLLFGFEVAVPIPLGGQTAVFIYQIVRGRKFVHAFEEGLFRSGVLESEVGAQRVLIDLLDKIRMVQKTFDLAAENQTLVAGDGVVVEGLDAEDVPGAEQALALRVPNHKAIHAAQAVHHIGAPLLVAVYQNFCVGMAVERVAFGFQLLAQLHEIVDLAVKGDDDGALFVFHGLRTCLGQVQNGQAAESQGHVFVGIHAAHVRSAVYDAVHHALQNGLFAV